MFTAWKLIYCVTATLTKLKEYRAKLRVKCQESECSVGSVLGVAVQSLSLVVSLSNEAL